MAENRQSPRSSIRRRADIEPTSHMTDPLWDSVDPDAPGCTDRSVAKFEMPTNSFHPTPLPTLSVIGVSHHTCPVEVREKFAYTGNYTPDKRANPKSETIWLSTCNRTEMYSAFQEAADAEYSFAKTLGLPSEFATRCTFKLEGADAVQRLFRVASGLESLVVGEDEILGQVRRARY